MKILKLFFDPKDKQHYYIPDDKLICNHCNKDILELVIFQFNWSKKSYMQQFCINCIKKRKEKKLMPIEKEEYITLNVDKVPKYSYPIFIRPPNLQPVRSDISVFEAGKLEFREKDQPTSNYDKLQCARRIKKIDVEKAKKQLKDRIEELDTPIGVLNIGYKSINYFKSPKDNKMTKGIKIESLSANNINKTINSAKKIDAYLKDIQEAAPQIEAGDKKLLEEKSNER